MITNIINSVNMNGVKTRYNNLANTSAVNNRKQSFGGNVPAHVTILITELKASENLRLSPVSFLVGDLVEFLGGKLHPEEFSDRVLTQTKKAQFYFKRMPVPEMKRNLQVFHNEFSLADEINTHIMNCKRKNKPASLMEVMLFLVNKYNMR